MHHSRPNFWSAHVGDRPPHPQMGYAQWRDCSIFQSHNSSRANARLQSRPAMPDLLQEAQSTRATIDGSLTTEDEIQTFEIHTGQYLQRIAIRQERLQECRRSSPMLPAHYKVRKVQIIHPNGYDLPPTTTPIATGDKFVRSRHFRHRYLTTLQTDGFRRSLGRDEFARPSEDKGTASSGAPATHVFRATIWWMRYLPLLLRQVERKLDTCSRMQHQKGRIASASPIALLEIDSTQSISIGALPGQNDDAKAFGIAARRQFP